MSFFLYGLTLYRFCPYLLQTSGVSECKIESLSMHVCRGGMISFFFSLGYDIENSIHTNMFYALMALMQHMPQFS